MSNLKHAGNHCLRVFAFAAFLFCGCALPLRAAPPGTSPASFITALSCSPGGDVWLGTEDRGAFRWDVASRRWQNFRAADGLADDTVYAVAADRLGRVWCGTLNHGASVYNGAEWRNFNAENAPLGERVFDIQCSPADGDVWIATSAGLARYREADRAWLCYTRADGLPADQVQCLAFNKAGDVFAGLQCGGIAIARAADGFRRWETVAAPWRFDESRLSAPYPFEPFGKGLPGNLVNAVLVARNGTVWAGTCTGLVWSRDDGRSWKFLRGRNYAARVKGLYGGPPPGWEAAPKDILERLLPEDYVTSLAEAADGTLWVGFREQGCAALNPATGAVRRWVWAKPGDADAPLSDGYVKRLLAFPDGGVLAGGYGGGIMWVETPSGGASDRDVPRPGRPPPLPPPAAPPDNGELTRMAARLASAKTNAALPEAPPCTSAKTGPRRATGWGGTGGGSCAFARPVHRWATITKPVSQRVTVPPV